MVDDLRPTTLVVDRGRLARILGTLRSNAIDLRDQASGASDDPHRAAQLQERARQMDEDADMLIKSVVPSDMKVAA